jgi:hypothetical protein
MEILYGILIAALCVASAFGGFVLCMKVKRPTITQRVYPLGGPEEIKEIQDRAFKTPHNIEKPPETPSGFADRFSKTASEELKNATRPT